MPPTDFLPHEERPRVTFLVDENLSPRLVAELEKIVSGHQIRHVRDLNMCGTKDDVLRRILDAAANPVIITADEDFLAPQRKLKVIFLYRRQHGNANEETAQIKSVRRNEAIISAFAAADHRHDHNIIAIPIGRRAPSRRLKTPLGQLRMPIVDPVRLGEKYPALFARKLHANGWHLPVPPSMRLDPVRWPEEYRRGIPDPV